MSDASKRVVVFTGDFGYSVRRNVVELDDSMPGMSWLIVVHSPPTVVGALLRRQRKNFKKHGWRWAVSLAGELSRRIVKWQDSPADGSAPGCAFELASILDRGNVQVFAVPDIHSDDSIARVSAFQPDLGLSLAAPILRESLFSVPKMGTINLHKGKIPDFKGMPPAFWELWTDQAEVGCTVHQVNSKLDDGEVLARTVVQRARYSTPLGLQRQLDECGVALVCNVAQAMLNGERPRVAQPESKGKTWHSPTLAQRSELARRLNSSLPNRQAAFFRRLKDCVFLLALAWHWCFGWRIAKPRVTVLLYHRVTDDARDNLSVGVGQFDRHMALLRKFCCPVSLEDILKMDRIPRSRRPLVAVTFDDGYLDNHDNAAPILIRYRIPCAFFVTTGVVGNDGRFPHDDKRGNPPIAVMGWGEVRQMKEAGFTIGSHTVSHVDCVAESESIVMDELLASRKHLTEHLGQASYSFAYPYGGRHQMSAARLALVKSAGYEACLSAYGGSNIGQVDRWNVLRRGIHWEFSEIAFLHQTLGR